jgi:hypothetical protein
MKRGKILDKKKGNNKNILFIILITILIVIFLVIVLKFTGYSVKAFPSKTAVCFDSDSNLRYRNGINYYVKGICRDKTRVLEDKCFNGNTIQEAHCSSDKLRCLDTLFYCAYGCENGVCRSKK